MNNIDTKNPLEREPITTDLVDTKTAIEFQNMQKDEYTDVAHKAWENLIAPHTANQKALAEQVQAAKNAEEKLQNNPYAKDKLVQTLQTKIDTDPALTDADGNKIQELLKQGKYREAIKAGFELISNAIFGGKERKTEIGFPKFRQLDEEVSKLDLGKKSTSELTSLQEYFEGKISDAGSVKRKVSYTYLLSAVKDQVAQRDEKAKSRTEIIEKQLQVGSVILLNKQNAGTGGMLLQDLSENDVDMTHVIVITEMGPPVRFSHATEHKFSNTNRSGVETNVPLWDYLK